MIVKIVREVMEEYELSEIPNLDLLKEYERAIRAFISLEHPYVCVLRVEIVRRLEEGSLI